MRGGGVTVGGVGEAAKRLVPSSSDSDELRRDVEAGAKSKVVAANWEHIMAAWLDVFMQTRGKELVGSMGSSMMSGLTEQAAGLTKITRADRESARGRESAPKRNAGAARSGGKP